MSAESTVNVKTAVIGAGISGLTTAYALEQQGESVLVLEAGDRPGGVIRSERTGSFLFEYGPNSLLKKSSEVEELIHALDLDEQVLVAGEKSDRRYVVRDDRLHAVPMDIASFFSTDLLSWSGKGALLLEPFRKPGGTSNDESLASFIRRRLGNEALTYLVNPMVAGIYAGAPERMSALSSAKKFARWEREYGSLLNGAMASKLEQPDRGDTNGTKRKLISFTEGMDTIAQRMADRLSDSVRYGHEVQKIEIMDENQGYRLRVKEKADQGTIHFDANQVVVTTPAYTTAELLQPIDRKLSARLREIYYPPLAVVLFGYQTYRGMHPLDGFGFLVPEVERRHILGSLWNATIFSGRAPEEGAVFTTFLGGARQPEIARNDEEELVRYVREDLNELIGLESEPDVIRVKKWKKSIPQYERGHRKVMERLKSTESENPGLYIHGNYRDGVSVPACIQKGISCARRVTETNSKN